MTRSAASKADCSSAAAASAAAAAATGSKVGGSSATMASASASASAAARPGPDGLCPAPWGVRAGLLASAAGLNASASRASSLPTSASTLAGWSSSTSATTFAASLREHCGTQPRPSTSRQYILLSLESTNSSATLSKSPGETWARTSLLMLGPARIPTFLSETILHCRTGTLVPVLLGRRPRPRPVPRLPRPPRPATPAAGGCSSRGAVKS
mmetsp:Transcript_88167/g.249824  ORF Transcript_88167/g.249824 Transcript_88167/m.249824 type:complete len:212 (+) Transcript_88167:2100-2735(+)